MKYLYLVLLTIFPTIVGAQASAKYPLVTLVNMIKGFLGSVLIPLLITLALVAFFWNIVKSIYKSGEKADAVKDGKMMLIWGVIALFVMISVWGLVGILTDTLGINSVIPQLEKR
jgi:uncharacterized membrane protein (GlpM family)